MVIHILDFTTKLLNFSYYNKHYDAAQSKYLSFKLLCRTRNSVNTYGIVHHVKHVISFLFIGRYISYSTILYPEVRAL